MRRIWGDFGYRLWCRAAAFVQITSGDYLALDPETNPRDPAVAYLSHDCSETDYLAPSFTEFLETWEELSYLGPELWFLYLDELASADTRKVKADELRRLLTPPLRQQ